MQPERDDSSLVTYSPCCWPMAQAPSPPGAKTRPWVSQQSPEVTLVSTLSLGSGLARLTPPEPCRCTEQDFACAMEQNSSRGLGERLWADLAAPKRNKTIDDAGRADVLLVLLSWFLRRWASCLRPSSSSGKHRCQSSSLSC